MQYFVVDAFADALFKGNPAGVCVLEHWPDPALLQQIAAENNLAETAFLVREEQDYALRWFTPKSEMDLCGHATMGAAFVIFTFLEPKLQKITFHTASGFLTVTRKGNLLEMDFPVRHPKPLSMMTLGPQLAQAFGVEPLGLWLYRDVLVLVEGQQQVEHLSPDWTALRHLPVQGGIVVTAQGDVGGADFVSRFFTPALDIPEDPVTGSSHCMLTPFWAERLGKHNLVARQLSARGGTLHCLLLDERVLISGRAVLYLKGELQCPIK